jgi:hypothetical protein
MKFISRKFGAKKFDMVSYYKTNFKNFGFKNFEMVSNNKPHFKKIADQKL